MVTDTIAHSLLGLVLPPACTCCGEPADRTHDGMTVCAACRKALADVVAQPYCPRCGRTVGPYASCGQCSRKSPPFQAAVRVGIYNSPLGDMVQALKYRDGVHTLPLLANLLLARLHQAGIPQRADVVTAVPLHWWRCYRRGFNQAVVLARTVVRRGRLGLPLERLLVRTRDTPPQVGLSATARRENVRGAFRVRRPAAVKDRRILLLDDVMTTGATVGECARALRRAGAREVIVAVAAVAGPGPMPVASGPAAG